MKMLLAHGLIHGECLTITGRRHRLMKGALAAFFVATLAVAANAQTAPPAEQLQAQPDSPFIQRLLAQPFEDDHDTTLVAVQTLRASGNAAQAGLLERAEQRRLLALMVGEPPARPATFKDAITRETDSPPLDDGIRGALGRVELTYASERDPDAAPAGADETRVADGVWTKPSMDHTQVHALFRIHNGLPVPLRTVGLRIVATQGNYLSVTCEPENPRDIAPGSTRVVLCDGDDRSERIGDALRALVERKARAPLGPSWFYVGNIGGAWQILITAFDGRPTLSFENGRKDGTSEAFAALAGAACQDKGTCAVIAQAEQQRVEAERKKTAPSRNFGIGALVAFLLAAVAAAAVKPRRSPGSAMPIIAVLVIVFAAFAVATGYYSLQPDASVAWLLPMVVVYHGCLPFFIALAAVFGSLLSGNVTRLRVFAAAFGLGVSVLTWVTFAFYQ
jgi:hypothetical protein